MDFGNRQPWVIFYFIGFSKKIWLSNSIFHWDLRTDWVQNCQHHQNWTVGNSVRISLQISLPKRNSNIIHFSIFTAMMLVEDLHNIYSNLNNTFLSLIIRSLLWNISPEADVLVILRECMLTHMMTVCVAFTYFTPTDLKFPCNQDQIRLISYMLVAGVRGPQSCLTVLCFRADHEDLDSVGSTLLLLSDCWAAC